VGHLPLTGLRLPEAVGVPAAWQSLPQPLVWVVDWVVLGPAAAPPEGLEDVADVVEGAWPEVGVVVVEVGLLVDDVVEEADELVAAAGADV
jgi:hypothetical protein